MNKIYFPSFNFKCTLVHNSLDKIILKIYNLCIFESKIQVTNATFG